MHGKRLRPRRGGRGWVVEWGPLWSPVVLPSRGTRATTRVPTLPITTPAPTGTRGLLPKKPIPERPERPAPMDTRLHYLQTWAAMVFPVTIQMRCSPACLFFIVAELIKLRSEEGCNC